MSGQPQSYEKLQENTQSLVGQTNPFGAAPGGAGGYGSLGHDHDDLLSLDQRRKWGNKWQRLHWAYRLAALVLFLGGIAAAVFVPLYVTSLSIAAAKLVILGGAVFSLMVAVLHAFHVAVQDDPPGYYEQSMGLFENAFGANWRATENRRWGAAATIGLGVAVALAAYALPLLGVSLGGTAVVIAMKVLGSVLAAVATLVHLWQIKNKNDTQRHDPNNRAKVIGGVQLQRQWEKTGNAKWIALFFMVGSLALIIMGALPGFLTNMVFFDVTIADILLGSGVALMSVVTLGHIAHTLSQRAEYIEDVSVVEPPKVGSALTASNNDNANTPLLPGTYASMSSSTLGSDADADAPPPLSQRSHSQVAIANTGQQTIAALPASTSFAVPGSSPSPVISALMNRHPDIKPPLSPDPVLPPAASQSQASASTVSSNAGNVGASLSKDVLNPPAKAAPSKQAVSPKKPQATTPAVFKAL